MMFRTPLLVALAASTGSVSLASATSHQDSRGIDAAGAHIAPGRETQAGSNLQTGRQAARNDSDHALVELRTLKERAASGEIEALLELGQIYFDGKMVERDIDEAYRLFDRAAKKGSVMAKMAALSIRFIGAQSEFQDAFRSSNSNIEDCPEPHQNVKLRNISDREFFRSTEWPIMLDYFVVENQVPKFSYTLDYLKKIDYRSTFQAKLAIETPISKCFLIDYYVASSKGDGFYFDYAREQLDQYGQHNQFSPYASGELKGKFVEGPMEMPYQMQSYCINNYSKTIFNPKHSDHIVFSRDGSSYNVSSDDIGAGIEISEMSLIIQDKSGLAFLIDSPLHSDFSKEFLQSGSSGESGRVINYGAVPFGPKYKYLLIFRSERRGYHCEFKSAPKFNF